MTVSAFRKFQIAYRLKWELEATWVLKAIITLLASRPIADRRDPYWVWAQDLVLRGISPDHFYRVYLIERKNTGKRYKGDVKY